MEQDLASNSYNRVDFKANSLVKGDYEGASSPVVIFRILIFQK